MTGWRGPGTTWDGGKSDYQQLQEAARIVAECLAGRLTELEIEPTLWIPNDGSPPFTISSVGMDSFATAEDEDGMPGPPASDAYSFRRPDIAAFLDGCASMLLVELDGSWHDTVPGRRATDRRDRDYRAAGISCIAIRLSEYPAEGAWQNALRAAIGKKVANIYTPGGAPAE